MLLFSLESTAAGSRSPAANIETGSGNVRREKLVLCVFILSSGFKCSSIDLSLARLNFLPGCYSFVGGQTDTAGDSMVALDAGNTALHDGKYIHYFILFTN